MKSAQDGSPSLKISSIVSSIHEEHETKFAVHVRTSLSSSGQTGFGTTVVGVTVGSSVGESRMQSSGSQMPFDISTISQLDPCGKVIENVNKNPLFSS
jgi:hypothetical protein